MKLKELAPYLPYGLKMLTMDGYVVPLIKLAFTSKSHSRKPILRPLSDLTKEIEHNGDHFIPYEHHTFVEAMAANEYLEYLCEAKASLAEDRLLPYSIVQLLFEWHFDVFGLIEKGEAIDINKINYQDGIQRSNKNSRQSFKRIKTSL